MFDAPSLAAAPRPRESRTMRAVKHLVPLVLAATLLAGCEDPRAVVATATASAPVVETATSTLPPKPSFTSTPIPIQAPIPPIPPVGSPRAWDVPPKTGIAYLDAIVTAMVAGDAEALERYVVGGSPTPCDISWIPCPEGIATGTPIRVLTAGGGGGPGCQGGGDLIPLVFVEPDSRASGSIWVTPRRFAADYLASQAWYLGLIRRAQPAQDDDTRFHLVFQSSLNSPDRALIVSVSDMGITGIYSWEGAHCAPRGKPDDLIPLAPS